MKPYWMSLDQIGTGAIDFSNLLDAPAGKYGFVQAKNGHLYFENGKRIRFFGVNLVLGGAMPEKNTAVKIADRLAHSGINIARLHHIERYEVGEDTDTIIDYSGGNSQKLHEKNIDRLDFLVSELKKRGIYIHIDLYTQRMFLEGDELDYQDTFIGDSRHYGLKNVVFYNRRIIDLHKKFVKQYLTHKNSYTGLRYVDEPAVAAVQLLNENSVFFSDGTHFPSYEKDLNRMWNQWLVEKYRTREALDRAWTKEDGTKGLGEDEDPGQGTVKDPGISTWEERRVDYRTDYTSVTGPARLADLLDFLSEVETGYNKEMIAYLKELGVKCMINAGNLAKGVSQLQCITQGDVTENNAYWNHPLDKICVDDEMYAKAPWKGGESFDINIISYLSRAKVADKPFMVTEWNVCYPTKFRADVPLMLVSYACLQDWDGIILFEYYHSRTEEVVSRKVYPGYWESYNDPAVWGLMGVMSSIFQEGLVKEAQHQVEVCYTRLDSKASAPKWDIPYKVVPYISRIAGKFMDRDRYEGDADMVVSSGFTSTGDYTKAKHAIVYARSPYIDRYQKVRGKDEFLALHTDGQKIEVLRDSRGNAVGEMGDTRCVLPDGEVFDRDEGEFCHVFKKCMKKWGLADEGEDTDVLVSDTGELIFNHAQGEFTVQNDKMLSFSGSSGRPVRFGGIVMDIENHKASITVLPRDGKALAESRHLLVTALGESVKTNMVWDGKKLVEEGTEPFLIDPIKGTLYLPTDYRACRAYALDQCGERREELEVKKSEDGFELILDSKEASIYFEVVFEN